MRTTLVPCGWIASETRKRPVMPEPWRDLLAAAKTHGLDRPLAPFFRYCHRLELTPDTVTAETLQAYGQWLASETLAPKPSATTYRVQQAWRKMRRLEPTWPAADVRLPSRRIIKRRTDFSEEFDVDVTGYLDSLRKYHPRDRTYRHPLSPAAVRIVKYSILRAATYLANTGIPIGDITGIATLVKPQLFEKILLAALDDARGRWNVLAKHIAENLFLAARRWVKPSEEVLKDLEEQMRCVRVSRSERRRRELLAQFATPEDRKELFDLPWRAFEQADLMLKRATQSQSPVGPAAKLHEVALAMALLFTQPIRARNLVALDIRHLGRDRRGKLTRLFIDAHEVKNGIAIEILLPEPLAARFERHFETFRPILLRGAASSAVFPGVAGQPITTQSMGKRIRRIVERQLGAQFTPHLARHLVAEILLEADVNNLPLAQRLLGHTVPSTTAHIYGGPRTSAAQQALARLVDSDRLAVEARDGRKKIRRLGRGL